MLISFLASQGVAGDGRHRQSGQAWVMVTHVLMGVL